MRCSASAERVPLALGARPGTTRRPVAGGLLIGALLLPAGVAGATDFTVLSTDTRVVDGSYVLDARLDLALAADTREALANGVPITVVIEARVLRRRRLLWDQNIATVASRYRVELHELSGRYLLRSLDNGRLRSYRTVEGAVRALGQVEAMPVLPRERLEPDQRYAIKLRARLDIEELPSPLRPLAYLASLWGGGSDWHVSPLRQ